MMDQTVCLFPLANSVTLNKISIPYHIFEPRYIQMVQDCVLNGNLIAVLLPDWNSQYKNRVCIAGRPSIIQRFETGQMDIVITGIMKCELTNKINSNPYLIYSATQVFENFRSNDEIDEDLTLFKAFIWQFVDKNPALRNQARVIEGLLDGPEAIVNYTTLLLIPNPKIKTKIMESSLLIEKVNIIKEYLLPTTIDMGPFLPPIEQENNQ